MRRPGKSCFPILWLLAFSIAPARVSFDRTPSRPGTATSKTPRLVPSRAQTKAPCSRTIPPPSASSFADGRIPVLNTTLPSAHRPPHATLEDWAGAVFIPNVTLEHVQAVVTDYAHYADRYGPVIRASRLLGRTDDSQRFRLRYVRKALFEVMAYEIDYESHHCQTSGGQWYSTTRSLAVHQVGNFGKPDEFQMPADDPNAFIWRTVSFVEIDEADGGAYLTQESIVLGHPIPVFWRWIVDPFVDRLARDLVTGWLRQTRDAVTAAASAAPAMPVRKLPQCTPPDSPSADQVKSWSRNQK